jgi:CIC family chloride channel protein
MRHFSRILDRIVPKEGLVLLILAIGVGALTGLAAVFFIQLIEVIHTFTFGNLAGLAPKLGRVWFIIIPVLGALLGGPIIVWFASEAKGHGVPEVMQALILRGGRIRPRVAIAKILASALCIGTGGSAGREGPIVQVGSTLASAVGQWLKLSDDRIKNLVACGAAAGIAATFNAPLAGIVFSLEVLLSELQMVVFGNVVIASISASIVSRLFLGARPAFSAPKYALNSPEEILLYILLGLFAALVGIFFIRLLDAVERFFDRLASPQVLKPAIGALLLGISAYFYPHILSFISVYSADSRLGMPVLANIPHVYGSGFDFIDNVLQGHAPFALLFLLVFLKPLATSFTLAGC